MADDRTRRGPPDNRRIDINDPDEVRNWCLSFGCTPADLSRAVKAAGNSAADVQKYLKLLQAASVFLANKQR